jgi:hypothetical protein
MPAEKKQKREPRNTALFLLQKEHFTKSVPKGALFWDLV